MQPNDDDNEDMDLMDDDSYENPDDLENLERGIAGEDDGQ